MWLFFYVDVDAVLFVYSGHSLSSHSSFVVIVVVIVALLCHLLGYIIIVMIIPNKTAFVGKKSQIIPLPRQRETFLFNI